MAVMIGPVELKINRIMIEILSKNTRKYSHKGGALRDCAHGTFQKAARA